MFEKKEYPNDKNEKEKEALFKTLRKFVEGVMLHGDYNISLEVVAEDVIGIGMGEQGYYTGKDELRKLFADFHKQPGGGQKNTVEYDSVDIRITSPESATINAKVYITTDIGCEKVKSGLMQMAGAKKENGEWLFCILNAIPLILTEESIEAYPLSFADETLTQLKTDIMEKRSEMLDALNKMSVTLFSYNEKKFDETMNEGLRYVVDAAKLDRVTVFKYSAGSNLLKQIYCWCRENVASSDEIILRTDISPMSAWIEKTSNNENIYFDTRKLPAQEYDFFEKLGIKSIFACPLFIHDEFWGVITLSDHINYRCFDGDILDLLHSAANLCAGAVLRFEMEREINEVLEQLTAASLAKSRFLANMSHEIRTPMNSIIGFAELALDSKDPVKIKDYLDMIMKNSVWLLQIINDILDISKIESGKMELESIPFDVQELFASCRALIMPKAIEKGLLLHFSAEPSLGVKPLGDPTRLRQVLLNLLSNAVKFTSSGTIKVSCGIKNTSDASITMSFSIIDSGIGMTSEQISRIFDPFTQADDTMTRKFGGTGLGLSITKTLVEMMGGMLMVESTPKAGSKFSFDLTFETINVSGNDDIKEKTFYGVLERPLFEGEVLLCEDSVMNQQMICEHLARVGLKTVVAENGKIGVDLVAERMRVLPDEPDGKKQFVLIFMDMHMPVMDGLEAASKILEMKTGIPMVALTANVMSNDIEIYRNSGMNDYVGKPFTSQELWRCLLKYLKPIGTQTVNEDMQAQAEDNLRRKLVVNFVKTNRDIYRKIKDAITEGDITLTHRIAHTLKSNAAQLGKILLQKAAAEIEQHINEGKLPTPQQLAALETELSAALAELTAQVEQFARLVPQSAASDKSAAEPLEPQAAAQIAPQAAQELFDKLEPLLDGGEPDSLKFVGALRCLPGSEKLIEQMENLDFHEAMKTLAELKSRS